MIRRFAINTGYYLLKNFHATLLAMLLKPLELFNKRVAKLNIKSLSDCHADPAVEYLWTKTFNVNTYESSGRVSSRVPFHSWVCRMRSVYVNHADPFIVNKNHTVAYTDAMDLNNANYNLSYGTVKFSYLDTAIMVSPRQSLSIDKGIFFLGKASNNYYHLVTEILTRLYALNFSAEYSGYPLLVDAQTLAIPQFKAALALLDNTRPIIEIKPGNSYLVADLIVPSDGARLPINLFDMAMYSANDCVLNPEAILHVRELFLAGHAKSEAKMARIFIGRKKTLTRRNCNEDALWDVARRYGFEKVYPEDYTLLEQIRLFSSCDYLIGNTGAAFTNILFLKPGTRILYWLSEKNKQFNSFSSLAKIVQVHHTFLTGKQTDPSDVHSYFEINLIDFEEALKQLIK